MRIIAGELRGRRIAAPEGEGTRPMLDRVREAVFSTLGEHVEDAVVLDLFAGSGALGLESASRGARSVRCIERAKKALDALKLNVTELGVQDRVRVVRGDALAPRSWHDVELGDVRYSLVFLDPPYPMIEDPVERTAVLGAIRKLFEAVLSPNAIVVLHVAARAGEMLRFGPGLEHEMRVYGTSAIVYVTAQH
ncbi:MAG: 16S rRNA (guanine(966)-N(2))-methyltransferase RsmD [Planctomycetes bacterium]|nr:16S rRNA (guanine(966)-N(2))-methyltransferase RsmD [Planctomycetota bacterium]